MPYEVTIKLGTMTRLVSTQTVEVNSMPRHVRDLRSAVPPEAAPARARQYETSSGDEVSLEGADNQ